MHGYEGWWLINCMYSQSHFGVALEFDRRVTNHRNSQVSFDTAQANSKHEENGRST